MAEPGHSAAGSGKKSDYEWCNSLIAKLGTGQVGDDARLDTVSKNTVPPDALLPETPQTIAKQKQALLDNAALAAMTTMELEEELKKKNAVLAMLAAYTEKGEFSKEESDYIRSQYGSDPVCLIKLADNDIPKGTPIAASYADEVSEEEKQLAERVIMKHFPQARITILKERGTGRDVWAMVGLDARLASGVLEMEKEKLQVQEEKKAYEEELMKREADKSSSGSSFAQKIQAEKAARPGVNPPPVTFTDRIAVQEKTVPGKNIC